MTNPQSSITNLLLLAESQVIIALLFIVPILVVVLIFYLVNRHERKRIEALQQVAAEIGLPFYPQGNDELIGRLRKLFLFSQGRAQKTNNMLHGVSNDVEMAILDYQYTVGGGKNKQTLRQSVVYFRSELLRLPYFALRPEGFFHKIGGAFGYQDIDFDTHPHFSSMYLLRGTDEAAIRNLFHADLLSFFETKPKICVEGGGDQLIFYRPSKRIGAEEVRAFMQEGFEVYTAFRGEMPPSEADEPLPDDAEPDEPYSKDAEPE
jgi:carbonic anhydrase